MKIEEKRMGEFKKSKSQKTVKALRALSGFNCAEQPHQGHQSVLPLLDSRTFCSAQAWALWPCPRQQFKRACLWSHFLQLLNRHADCTTALARYLLILALTVDPATSPWHCPVCSTSLCAPTPQPTCSSPSVVLQKFSALQLGRNNSWNTEDSAL